ELQIRRQLALLGTPYALPPPTVEIPPSGDVGLGFASFLNPNPLAAPSPTIRNLLLTQGPGFEQTEVLELALTSKSLRHLLPVSNAFAFQTSQLPRSRRSQGSSGNDPSVDLTATVVSAFRNFSYDGVVNFAYLAGLDCLRTAQQPNGSFGSATS